jgi:hypothetical protein
LAVAVNVPLPPQIAAFPVTRRLLQVGSPEQVLPTSVGPALGWMVTLELVNTEVSRRWPKGDTGVGVKGTMLMVAGVGLVQGGK